MNRREALAGLLGIPGVASVQDVLPVLKQTKALVLSVRDGVELPEGGYHEVKRQVQNLLAELGCSHVGVIILYGIDAVTVQ
jgi:hypothetical protein